MSRAGQIVLFRFPQTDLKPGKLRPAVLVSEVPGPYDDWLICMISSQIRQCIEGFDEVIAQDDEDFEQTGLKAPSVVRSGRLAIVEKELLIGSIGRISRARTTRIKQRLVRWLSESITS